MRKATSGFNYGNGPFIYLHRVVCQWPITGFNQSSFLPERKGTNFPGVELLVLWGKCVLFEAAKKVSPD